MLSADAGRLLIPLTNSNGWGGFRLIERHAQETRSYPAKYAGLTGIIHRVGGRDAAAEERLKAAMGPFAHGQYPILAPRAGRARRNMLASW